MRYKPFCHRPQAIEFNQRKASLFQRKQEREASALPLFAEQIREQQHDWESEKAQRQRKSDAITTNWRSREAALWRKARSMYFALPVHDRAACKRDWDTIFRGAWTPTNLIYLVEKFNGVGAAREEQMAAERRASNARIAEMVSAQPCLV